MENKVYLQVLLYMYKYNKYKYLDFFVIRWNQEVHLIYLNASLTSLSPYKPLGPRVLMMNWDHIMNMELHQ